MIMAMKLLGHLIIQQEFDLCERDFNLLIVCRCVVECVETPCLICYVC